MRAMILAAGRGVRMRPLTEQAPKPLLDVNGKPLIQYHVEGLVQAGIREIVINHARYGDQIEDFLGDGARFGARLYYSAEGDTPLETGGGIYKALPLLGDDPFIAINADIWTNYSFRSLPENPEGNAHLVLVHNPAHHPRGDFALKRGHIVNQGNPRYTFSGIGVYRRELFKGQTGGVFPLTPLLRKAADNGEVNGEIYTGVWQDIGTPERLQDLRLMLSS